MVHQNGENAYLIIKIAKSFWGPKVAPGPHVEKGLLRSHDAAAHRRQFRPVTIWAPPRSNPGSAPEIIIKNYCLEYCNNRHISYEIKNENTRNSIEHPQVIFHQHVKRTSAHYIKVCTHNSQHCPSPVHPIIVIMHHAFKI